MKVTGCVLALAATAIAVPSQTLREKPRAVAACPSAVSLNAQTNIWQQYTLHANSFYRSEVEAAANATTDPSLRQKIMRVADIGTFVWVDTRAAIQRLRDAIVGVPCNHVLGVVIYDLPGRDCAAKASNGELQAGQINVYKSQYIDPIVQVLKANPNTAFALVIEPDSLPNLVTNADLSTCQQSASGYREGTAYAMRQLNLPNVVMYMDAGHGGWLGWNDNLQPGAQELASVYRQAGSPSQVRGFSTNVAGWNSWDASPGEFSGTSDAQWNKAQNERLYVEMFSQALSSAGMPNHAIVDTSRSGVQGLRDEWGDWCNVDGAGFGPRPTANTGYSMADAFVWVKPGGESDGTSDSSATRYDSFCGKPDAYKPSPEAGTWNQAYFEMLVRNANPPL